MAEVIEYRFDVQAFGEDTWSSNFKVYATKELAEEAARDLFSRWNSVADWRAVPTTTPRNEKINAKDRKV